MNYGKFEMYPESERPLVGKFWTQKDLDKPVCGALTTMNPSIAETYARDPEYYGATFCVKCRDHLPVGPFGEFVWADAFGRPTEERVGT